MRIAALIDHVGAAIRNHLSGGRARLPMAQGQSSPRFADYARARLGLPEVDLFSQVEQPDKQEWGRSRQREWSKRPHFDSTFS